MTTTTGVRRTMRTGEEGRMDKDLRILIVEDVATDAELALRELKKADLSCVATRVETKRDFVRALDEFHPDVVLADYSLPQMTALDALHILQERPASVPFVLFTGSQSEEVAVQCMKEGADDYILKTSLKRLPSAIVNAINKVNAEREKGRAEAALRRSEEQHRLIAEHTLDLICMYDVEGRFTFLSPSATGILGYAPSELLGTDSRDIIHPDDKERVAAAFRHSARQGEVRSMEYRILHRNGQWRIIEASGRWISDETGQPHRAVVIARDVTERAHLEAQLRQAQKMEGIGTLAGGIAHDFNNLLGIILGHTFLMEQGETENGRLKQNIDAINKTVNRGAGLVRQLLTFARKSDSMFESVEVAPIIDELVRMLRETMAKNIRIEQNIDGNLPRTIVDQNQIHQALLNLCVNARDAMPDGGTLVVSADVVACDPGPEHPNVDHLGNFLRLRVSDTGQGMDEATRARMFDPFFTTKPPGKGTGLGLAVVYGVIKNHHGFIEVDSQPGQGTTFRLFIPLRDEETPAATGPGDSEPPAEPGTGTILVVEDEPMLLDLLSSLLQSNGYAIIRAADGAEALRVYAERWREIDLVVSDVGLPEMGGIEVFRQMVTINPGTKAIFASGYLGTEERQQLRRNYRVDFLQKPYKPAEVLRKIATMLTHSSTNGQ